MRVTLSIGEKSIAGLKTSLFMLFVAFAVSFICLSVLGIASVAYFGTLFEYQYTNGSISTFDVNNTVNVSVIFPENNTIYFNLTTAPEYGTIFPNMTINSTVNGTCYVEFDRNGTQFALINTSVHNTTWSNNTYLSLQPRYADDSWHNLTFNCTQTNGTHLLSSFTTASELFRYKFYGGDYEINVISSFVNNSWYKNTPKVNISTNLTASNCYAVFNAGKTGETSVQLVNTSIGNSSGIVYYTNVSSIDSALTADYVFNGTHGTSQNVTYYCTNAWGNKTWANKTINQTTNIFIDRTAPLNTTAYTFTIGNYSSGGNYLNMKVNFTDNYTSSVNCYIMGYHEYTNHTSVPYNFSTESAMTYHNDGITTCEINVTPSDIEADGRYYLRTLAYDHTTALDGTPNIKLQQSKDGVIDEYGAVFIRLKTGWNLITVPMSMGNPQLNQLAGMTENITYVSMYPNENKTYITYTKGATTNADRVMYPTNATYVYVAEDNVLMYNYVRSANAINNTIYNTTLYSNTTKMGGWNIVSTIAENVTLNNTLWFDGCSNTASQNCSILSYVSMYDTDETGYCTATRKSKQIGSICYPDYTSLNYTIPFGKAYWVYTTANTTYNMTRGATHI